ncbi:hypothetical protein [Burkholderia ubonensis]|uniref:hypothetical protein n=1 Tax=Burkholderia ubonensis TaxID=101571 RepID=UPI00075EBEA0|nr:hypothetical protein [Burkholderia ubonensis]KVP16930.1 hypothetical protein WJ84_01260 [Burkholderia ubonensis]KVP39946.1 hypothetical protein WJ87_07110 [Burkholderia ubonensis]
MKLMARTRLALTALSVGLAVAMAGPVQAKDLGVEGQVFEPIEEDMRVMLMRLLARQDWSESQQALEDSARNYTKNLPAYFLPRADKTETVWKDVGVVVTEDIYLPWVDWQTGSVFEPQQKLAVEKGTYLNPISKLPASAIERLFIFDATDPDQLSLAKELMKQDIPQLNFMLVAGDLGELSQEMNRPIYHPPPTMLEKFHVTAVPTLIGFGRGQHQGHMAVTTMKLPADADTIKRAWFGLPHEGYDPQNLSDVVPQTPSIAGATDAAKEVLSPITTTQQPAENNQKR